MKSLFTFLAMLWLSITYSQNPFITTWKTDNPGVSADNQITIPTFPGETYNYSVDWGDGTTDTNIIGNITHTYTIPGTYQVEISGVFPRIYFHNEGDKEKILSIDQWGTILWTSMEGAFHGCENLDMLGIDTPNLSSVASIASMFAGCKTMQADLSINNWNTSSITNMSSAFAETFEFNTYIGNWDVTNVTDMSRMFFASFSFNQYIGSWNVTNVRTMNSMFSAAYNFDQDLGNWDVSQVENMSYMFYNLFNFNQNITVWNVSNVTDMSGMFASCSMFNQDISNWDVSNVTNMSGMFNNARKFDQDLTNWNVSKVTDMSFMFHLAYDFNQDLGFWNVENVEDMTGMFQEISLSQLNYDNTLIGWNNLSSLKNNVVFGGGNNQFCESAIVRQNLIENYGWSINDGGKNCPQGLDDIWLEAECGIVGSNWQLVESNQASRNNFLLSNLGSESTPPVDENSIVSFVFDANEGNYNLYGRLNILNVESSGLWVRINDGEWLIWNNTPTNSQFEWYVLEDESNTETRDFLLEGGQNTIEVASQNNGVNLDKLFITSSNLIPNGFGYISSNCEQRPFVTTWKTDILNEGDTRITIPTISGGYDFNVDWGDGTQNTDVTNTIEHFYATPGTYSVSISGEYPRFYPYETVDTDKLISIDSWGDIQWTSMEAAFSNCDNLDLKATDVPNLSRVRSLNNMFSACLSLVGNESISKWDVSEVKTFQFMFAGASQFNQNISGWNVAKGTNFASMFSNAESFNGDISSWNMENAKRMDWMFHNALSFNQPIGIWNVESVENMSSMFNGATSFDQNLENWNVSKVQYMDNMFNGTELSLNNYDNTLIGWSELGTLQNNLELHGGDSQYCTAENARQNLINNYGWSITDAGKNCPFITTWKTDNPGVTEDNQINIPTFPGEIYNYSVDWGDGTSDTNVTSDITHTYAVSGTYQISISGIFPRIYINEAGDKDKLLNIMQWGNIAWSSMESAFAGCSNLSVAANDSPDLSNVTSLRRMFYYCNYSFDITWSREFKNFNGIENFNKWNVSTITDMANMFDKSAFGQDISSWDVSNVTDMAYLFFSTQHFNHDISNWDVGNVVNMEGTFGSSSFIQDVTGWNVSNVTNMDFLFNSTYFDQDISNWNVSNVTSMRHMLSQSNFNQDISSWDISNVTDMSNIFDDNDLSRENYDKILISWSQRPNLQSGVALGAIDVQYCDGKEARETLININGWTIIDQGENCEVERPFITTWKTDNLGPSADNQITIPTNPEEVYNYNVDWGDGTTDTSITEDITHTYGEPGTYQVSITGRFPSIYFNASEEVVSYPSQLSDAQKIIAVNQWGTNRWISMAFAFAGCSNLDILATDIPDFSKDILLIAMFLDCTSLKGNETMAQWDLSPITSPASLMFSGASQFNQSVSNWDISNIPYIDRMFQNASSFNQNLENWDIRNKQNMDALFDGSGMSTSNYDKTVEAWGSQPNLQNNVILGASDISYCTSEMARQTLIDNYGWVINDAGKDCSKTYFITTWKTDNPGASADNQVSIPTYPGEVYDYNVDWGDGTNDNNVTGDITHTYTTSGIYQVSIVGTFPRIYFNNHLDAVTDAQKLITVDQWGEIEWNSMENSFLGCTNLDIVATDVPDLNSVSSLASMFADCSSLVGNETFNLWDLSSVNSINGMFGSAVNFNIYIGDWDVSGVTDIGGIFFDALAFNQDIGNWNVGKVLNMASVFYGASTFDQDISAWNVSKVTNMNNLFDHAISFNQDIGNWDVSSVTAMSSMFHNADSFNHDIGNWNVSNVEYMDTMFYSADTFNQDIGNWNVGRVKGMQGMFGYTPVFNQDISSWNVENVVTMKSLFNGATSFNQNIGGWNVANVENMEAMFFDAISFDQDISTWNITSVSNMLFMFKNSAMSIRNYDALLNSWSQQAVLQGIQLEADNLQYCTGEEGRQFLIENFNWTIIDNGKSNICNVDEDMDGVMDYRDNCLSTFPNVEVDANGCEIIPRDAILVYGLTQTCPGTTNGSIQVSSSLTDRSYNISLDGPTTITENNVSLNQPYIINNLSTGLYTVEISIPEASYTQSFGIQINEVGNISGKRENLDLKSKSVSYSVQGSHSYNVNINGTETLFNFDSTESNQIRLNDLNGFNTISISGESDCQGLIKDSFNFSDSVVMYPVNTKDKTFIEGYDEESEVQIFDISGRLLFQKKLQKDKLESIDLESYDSGIYPVKIMSKKNSQTFKIIKQ